jgi:SAM-dependent methyltransferase
MDLKEIIYKDKLNYYIRDKLGLIDTVLSKAISNNKNINRILSVGCGTAEELEILGKYGEVYAIDVEKEAVKFASWCKEVRICDVCELNYPDNFFDIVIALDVLEHIEDDKRAVEQVYRVLSQGGVFIFTVPAFQFLFSAHDRFLGHKRRYNKRMLETLLFKFSKLDLFFYNYLLFIPMCAFRILRKRSDESSDFKYIPKTVLFIPHIFSLIELFLLKTFNFKFKFFGLGICGIAYK